MYLARESLSQQGTFKFLLLISNCGVPPTSAANTIYKFTVSAAALEAGIQSPV